MAETKTQARGTAAPKLTDEQKRKMARNPMTLRQQERMNKDHGIPIIPRKGAMRDRDPEA